MKDLLKDEEHLSGREEVALRIRGSPCFLRGHEGVQKGILKAVMVRCEFKAKRNMFIKWNPKEILYF